MPDLSSLHIGPVCNGAVSLLRKGLTSPDRRELIFDIDLTDYEFLDLHTRDELGNEVVSLEACDAAWGFAAVGVFFLRYLLREHFGFEEFLIIYSGRRGVHLWVLDGKAMAASDEVRNAIATALNIELTKDKKRATPAMLRMVEVYDLWDSVEDAFLDLIVNSSYLDSFANLEDLVDRLGLKHDGMKNLADDAFGHETTQDRWQFIEERIQSIAKQHDWMESRMRETMLVFVWPRLDFNVTKAKNHLIKAPYVAHPKSGRIAVPIDPDDYYNFDPRTVPTLTNMGTDDSWSALTDIRRYITRDTPLLPMVTSHRKRERQARTSDDMEDLVPPPNATPRSQRKPKRKGFVRRKSPLVPEGM
jgi:DNA primase small subunit